MRLLFLSGWIFFSTVCLFGQAPTSPTADSVSSVVITREMINKLPVTEIRVIPMNSIRIIRMTRFGWSAGYTSAFAHVDKAASDGSAQTKPGFELSAVYRRNLYKRINIQTGLGFVARNFTVSAMGASFDQHNERWFVPLLLYAYPFTGKSKWIRGICVKAGTQVDFYNYSNAVTRWNASGVGNVVFHRSQPEVFAVAEIGWNLRAVRRIYNNISIAYAYGLNKTYTGTVGTVSQTALRYSNTGSYLSVKYTFFISRDVRR